MSDPPEVKEPKPARGRGRKPLVIGVVLAGLAGAGGFYATWSGLIFGPPADAAKAPEDAGHAAAADHGGGDGHGGAPAGQVSASPLPDIAFVAVEPVIISLGPGSSSRHLRFTAQLEVNAAHGAEVAMLMPRILDVLNGYLRAISVREIEDPASLVRLRAQMLRRVQMVTGEGRVRDLLVSEFVLN